MDADAQRSQLAATLRRVGVGDRAALRVVYQETSARLFGICLRILKDRSEAEAVLHDVYLAVWLKAGRFDPDRASPLTWLAAVARSHAIDRLRAKTANRSEPDEPGEDKPSAVDEVVPADQYLRLMICMGELDEQQAGFIRAAFLDGTSYEQMSARAGIPLDTTKAVVRRALLKLKGCIEQ